MDKLKIIFRLIEERDNREIAEIIRTVFREFKIDKPGTVYFDPTTDNLFNLFSIPGSEYWIDEQNCVIIYLSRLSTLYFPMKISGFLLKYS